MKCIGIDSFGGREKLQLMELPVPEVGPDEILIRVKAAGVNPVDWKIRAGFLEGRLPHQFPIILGWDAAGVIEKVGANVTRLQVSDEVMTYARKPIIQWGTYAEYLVVPESNVAKKPAKLAFEEAAALPLAGLTAYQALFDALKLQKGKTILIHAGAGGVGSYAIQLAKDIGAHVITTASKKNYDYVKTLGADQAIDYNEADFRAVIKETYPDGIDTVFDLIGGDIQEQSFEVLKDRGRFVSILAIPNEEKFKQQGYAIHYVFVAPNASQLEQLAQMVDTEKLKVFVTATFPLAEAARAHEQIESGHTCGKIVLIL